MSLRDTRFPVPLVPAWLRWLAVLAVAGVLFYYSVLQMAPHPPGSDPGPFWDKKLHFAGYAGLALALAYATADAGRTRRRIALVLGLAISYGVAIEFVQAPLPNRYFSVADMLANVVGALLATAWFVLEPRLAYVPLPRAVGRSE